MKNPIIIKIRKEQKEIAKEIARMKSARKGALDGHIACLHELSKKFRHRHIALCELRGVRRADIELCGDNHKPNEIIITQIKAMWTEELRELKRLQDSSSEQPPSKIMEVFDEKENF